MRIYGKLMGLTAAVAFAGSSALAVHLDNPNQLVDPGFEDVASLTFDGAPFVGFWEGFEGGGPTVEYSADMPRTGALSLELTIDNQPNNFAGVFQDVVVGAGNAGQTWWYSGWHKADAPGGSEIRIEWRDSVNDVEITRTPNATPSIGTVYEEFILSDVIPAGADTARVVYAIQSFGGPASQNVFVDDLNFNFVPEPASAALLGLGGLAMLRRRR